jgi:hypothetical protein
VGHGDQMHGITKASSRFKVRGARFEVGILGVRRAAVGDGNQAGLGSVSVGDGCAFLTLQGKKGWRR